jgi:precorrin-3B methylase
MESDVGLLVRFHPTNKGSLCVVGTGITLGSHLTSEAISAIQRADLVLFGLADAGAVAWIMQMNPRAQPLVQLSQLSRRDTYDSWVNQIVSEVLAGQRVCAVFYGHPGVFVYTGHEAIRRLRARGLQARMLPGISADSCLYADLGIDPARDGCLSLDATDFLVRRPTIDRDTVLLLWQVGAVGTSVFNSTAKVECLEQLRDALVELYRPEHCGILYEAPRYAVAEPRILEIRLQDLSRATLSLRTTLCVPRLSGRPISDEKVLR